MPKHCGSDCLLLFNKVVLLTEKNKNRCRWLSDWRHLNLPRFSGCRGSSFLSPPSSLCDAPNCHPPPPHPPPIPLRASHNRRHAHGGVEGVKGGGGTLPAEATASPCLPLLEGATAPSTAGSLARSLGRGRRRGRNCGQPSVRLPPAVTFLPSGSCCPCAFPARGVVDVK